MDKKRMMVLAIAIVMLVSLIFSGCANDAEKANEAKENATTEETKATVEEPIEMDFWIPGTSESEKDYWLSYIEQFETNNPNVTFEFAQVPWGNDMETKLNAAFASNTEPDVLLYSIASIAQRAGAGQYMPIDELYTESSLNGNLMDNIKSLGTYKDVMYGVGYRPNPHIFQWNKKMFAEAGLDPETPPQNWEEIAEYAKLLTIKEGGTTTVAGLNIPTTNGYQVWMDFMLQNGGSLVDVDTDQPLFASEACIESAEFLTNLVIDGVSIPSDEYGGINLFTTDRAAMCYGSATDALKDIKDNPERADVYGFAAPHTKVQQGAFCGLALLFITSETDQKELSWKFIEGAMTEDEAWKRYTDLGISVTINSLKDKFIEDNPEVNSATFEAISCGTGAPLVTYANQIFSDYVSTALQEAYYGEKTPREAFKEQEARFLEEIPELIK